MALDILDRQDRIIYNEPLENALSTEVEYKTQQTYLSAVWKNMKFCKILSNLIFFHTINI